MSSCKHLGSTPTPSITLRSLLAAPSLSSPVILSPAPMAAVDDASPSLSLTAILSPVSMAVVDDASQPLARPAKRSYRNAVAQAAVSPAFLSAHPKPQNSECISCNKDLLDGQWHTCFGCNKPIHGKVLADMSGGTCVVSEHDGHLRCKKCTEKLVDMILSHETAGWSHVGKQRFNNSDEMDPVNFLSHHVYADLVSAQKFVDEENGINAILSCPDIPSRAKPTGIPLAHRCPSAYLCSLFTLFIQILLCTRIRKQKKPRI
jgi:hypothetical protein